MKHVDCPVAKFAATVSMIGVLPLLMSCGGPDVEAPLLAACARLGSLSVNVVGRTLPVEQSTVDGGTHTVTVRLQSLGSARVFGPGSLPPIGAFDVTCSFAGAPDGEQLPRLTAYKDWQGEASGAKIADRNAVLAGYRWVDGKLMDPAASR